MQRSILTVHVFVGVKIVILQCLYFLYIYTNIFPSLLLPTLLDVQMGISAHVASCMYMNLLLSNTCTLFTVTYT